MWLCIYSSSPSPASFLPQIHTHAYVSQGKPFQAPEQVKHHSSMPLPMLFPDWYDFPPCSTWPTPTSRLSTGALLSAEFSLVLPYLWILWVTGWRQPASSWVLSYHLSNYPRSRLSLESNWLSSFIHPIDMCWMPTILCFIPRDKLLVNITINYYVRMHI